MVIHGHEQVPLPTNPLQMRKLFEVMKKRGLESLLKQIIQKKLFVEANKPTVGLSSTFSFEIIQYIIRGNKIGVDEKIQIDKYQGTVAHIFCYEGLIHKKNKGHPVFQILKYICEISNSSNSESVDSNNRTVGDLLKELDLEKHSILQPVLTSMSQSESQSSQHSPSPEKHVLWKFTTNSSPKKVLEEKVMMTEEEQEEIELPPKLSPTPTKKRKPQMIVMGKDGFSTPTRTKPKEISPTKRPQTIETTKKRKTRSKDVKYDTEDDCEDASPEPSLSTKSTRANSSNKPKTRSRVKLESTKDDGEDKKSSIKPEPSSKKDSPSKRPQTIDTPNKRKTRSIVDKDETSESEDETMTDTPQTPELITCALLSDEEGVTEDESTVRDYKNITRSSKKRKVEMVNVIVISDDEEEDFYESETDTE